MWARRFPPVYSTCHVLHSRPHRRGHVFVEGCLRRAKRVTNSEQARLTVSFSGCHSYGSCCTGCSGRIVFQPYRILSMRLNNPAASSQKMTSHSTRVRSWRVIHILSQCLTISKTPRFLHKPATSPRQQNKTRTRRFVEASARQVSSQASRLTRPMWICLSRLRPVRVAPRPHGPTLSSWHAVIARFCCHRDPRTRPRGRKMRETAG